jgi:hemerythrin-like domain-containing protein
LTQFKAVALVRRDHRRATSGAAAMTTSATLRMIRAEHQALAAVLRTMLMLTADARHHNRTPDFKALRAMLFYVDEFPERLHHVKETTMLFPRLREYTREADETLERLDREHAGGEARIRKLEHLLTAWELLGETRRQAFEEALDRYVKFYLEHMRVEEDEILPLVERLFGDDDWRVLDRAFGSHRDALTSMRPEAVYEALFATIVRVTPAPFGLGPSAS